MTKLKQVRLDRKYTQELLADACNSSVRTIQGYEQGAKSIDNASITTIINLCLALACNPDDILEKEENCKFFKLKRK